MTSENQWPEQLQQACVEQLMAWCEGPELEQIPEDAIGNELVRRLEAGQEAEVMRVLALPSHFLRRRLQAFSRYCPDETPLPWFGDDALWLKLAAALLAHDEYPLFDNVHPQRGARLSGQVREMLEAWVQQLRGEGTLPLLAVRSYWTKYLELLYWPGIGRETCLDHLAWAQALATEAKTGLGGSLIYLLQALSLADQLELSQSGSVLDRTIKRMLLENIFNKPDYEDWGPWLDYFAAHPEHYRRFLIRDERLIEQFWPQADADTRVRLVGLLVELVDFEDELPDRARVTAIFGRLQQDDAEAFTSFLQRHASKSMRAALGRLIWQQQYPALLPHLLPAIAECQEREPFRALLGEILQARPDLLETVNAGKLTHLLPLLDQSRLNACLPQITRAVASCATQELRHQLTALAGQFEPDRLQACGWVDKPGKRLMQTARDLLLAHPDPAAGPLLQQLLASGKLDIGSASQVEARLQALGLHQPPAGDDALALLETRVAGVSDFVATVEQVATPQILTAMAPLSAQAGRVLLQLTATAEEELPPLVFQLLEQIPPLPRRLLAQYLLENWIAAEGDPKQVWSLRLLAGSADDRLVDLLLGAIKAWSKPHEPRAALAVKQMAALDSPYALLHVQEIAGSSKYKLMVGAAATAGLHQAAARRGITTAELFDELTPDFGQAAGLTLTIGDRSYRVQLQGDLSLRVVDDKGKVGKSLPKPREAELLPLWDEAALQLKSLNAELKAVIKCQASRLDTALMIGQQWPLARWQRLFLQHPLLQVMGRSLIWTTDAGQSFRIAEDLALVDVHDNAVELADARLISLWHPVSAAEGEVAAWRAYLADYQLQPLINQLDAPSSLPGEGTRDDRCFIAVDDLKVPLGRLVSLLKRLGYYPDGPVDYCRQIDALGLRVVVGHDYFSRSMGVDHPVAIHDLHVCDYHSEGRNKLVDRTSLPLSLQATLFDHLQQITALASAV